MTAAEAPATGPLAGLRVVDFGRFGVGPAAGMYLGQLGAEVIKIESPTGDGSRGVLPLKQGVSLVYMTLNSNKKNILLDLRQPDEREVALRLTSLSDVLIENFRPGVIDRFGLGYEAVAARNPRIVYCSASGFGSRGPMRDLGSTDHFGQAISGFVSVNGEPGGRPEFLRQAGFVDLATSQRITQAILAGLWVRERTGRGQKVETSQLEAGLSLVAPHLAAQAVSGEAPGPLGSACPSCVPHQAFRAGDGRWLFVAAETPDQWRRLCAALERPALADDPRFARNRERVANRAALVALLAARLAERPAADWHARLVGAGVPSALHWAEPTHAPLWSDPHVVANELIQPTETPWGVVRIVRPAWRLSETPARLTRAPAPDEHAAELRALAATAATNGGPAAAAGEPSPAGRPFAGLRVVDLSQGWAGPSCAMLLGDLGADVVKVEPPVGDFTRELGPPFADGESALFLALNRSKRGVVLDLEREADRRALGRLVEAADVLITDLGPARAAALGLDYASLAAGNPGLVYCSVTAFGERGPYAGRPGAEAVIQGLAGVTRFLGTLAEPPRRVGADAAGLACGNYAFIGLLAALLRRRRSGRGQKVEVDQLHALLSTECSQLARESEPDEWIGAVQAAAREAEYPFVTADGPIHLTLSIGGGEGNWAAFFRDLGLPELADDPRFATARARQANHHALAEALAPRLLQLPADEVLALVYRHGGLGVRAHDVGSIQADQQVRAMGLLVEVDHPTAGRLRGMDVPFDLLGTPHTIAIPPPLLGQHTTEVLEELATRPAGGSDSREREGGTRS